MANATVARIGQVNQAGDALALFQKVFAGEVLTAFDTANVTVDKHLVRTIASGKSASFPVTGRVNASYHTPGAEIVGQATSQNEQIISIDALLLSDVFIADIDDAMNHYDVRSIYSREMGRKLAKQYDINVFRNLVKASVASAPITGEPGGTVIANDDFKVDVAGAADNAAKAVALAEGIYAAVQQLDENDAPENRFVALRPSEYYSLIQNKDVLNRDWGGSGSYSEGNVFRIAGAAIVPSNNVPKTDTSADGTNHAVNAAKTIGLVWTPEAVGTVKLMDLSMQNQYDIRRQGTLFVGRYAMGHGVLRPDCCVQLALSALSN